MRTLIKASLRKAIGTAAPLMWRLKKAPALMIVTYHRVLPDSHPERAFEQPGMYVSPETLAMNLEVLKRHFELMHLSEWLDRSRRGAELPRATCCVTFDDGWRDNFEFGFPVLERAGVPATIFLVSDFIGRSYDFWPNRLARAIRSMEPGPRAKQSRAAVPQKLVPILRAAGLDPVSEPAAATIPQIDAAIVGCKAMPDAELMQLLEKWATDAGIPGGFVAAGRSLLDESELRAMSAKGLVNYGSHSRRHTRLIPSLDTASLEDEVRGSRTALERVVGNPVDIFCYPNGDYSPSALNAVRSVYAAAVTTEKGWNDAAMDRHLLRRMSIHDDIARNPSDFLARVSGFL